MSYRGGAAGLIYLMMTNTSPEESSRKSSNGTIKLVTKGTIFLDILITLLSLPKFPLPPHRDVAAAFLESELQSSLLPCVFLTAFQQQGDILHCLEII